MAEEQIIPKHQQGELSRDDISALNFVLRQVRGSSPSSLSPLQLDEVEP